MVFSKEILDLADSIGCFIEYWGFKKIHGRIWTLLFLSKEPLDTQTLIQNLDVSKGLMSTSLNTLLDYDLIVEVKTENKKEKVYKANSKLSPIIAGVLKKRESLMLKTIETNFSKVEQSSQDNIDFKRVKRLKNYLKLGKVLLSGIMSFSKVDLSDWKKWED